MQYSLCFSWDFIQNFKKEYLEIFPEELSKKIDIPHCIRPVPYNYFNEEDYQKITTYRKIFDIPEDKKDKVILITFDAFMLQADFYINGHKLGHYISGWNRIELDITKFAKQKNNELIVVLNSKEDPNIPPFGYSVDYLTYGGIYREVYLKVLPKIYIEKSLVEANSEGYVKIRDFIKGQTDLPYKITHEISYKGKTVANANISAFKFDFPDTWSIIHPNLYTLKTTVISEFGKDSYETKFGFRDISVKEDGFYLNGEKIKLIGLNRHQDYPYVGYAMAKSAQKEDADILKYELGLNVVRASHYPQSKHFLDRCDEIGLLVINEIPGWRHIGNDNWKAQHLINVSEMVYDQFNHPSLIFNGVRINESQDDHSLYEKSNQIAREIDPTRPTIGVRNFKNSELLENVYGYNDFASINLLTGLTDPKKIIKNECPFLITEYLGHMEPSKQTDSILQKTYHALRHAKALNDSFMYENLMGLIGWCFADYHTHKDFGSGDHLCPYGVYDINRNPKFASYIYSSQSENKPVLEVFSSLRPGDNPGNTFGEIYVATNAEYIELYKNDEFVKRFYPNDDRFLNLKHPPIKIDDLIGETFKDSRFNEKDRKTMAQVLSFVSINGFEKLSISQWAKLGKLLIKYKLRYSDLVDIYNANIFSYNDKTNTYVIKSYTNDQWIMTRTFGPSIKFDLKALPFRNKLINDDSYDVVRIPLRYVDQYDNIMNYCTKAFKISVEGPIELLSYDCFNLIGGQGAIYVRSKNEKGTAKIIIDGENIHKELSLEVG